MCANEPDIMQIYGGSFLHIWLTKQLNKIAVKRYTGFLKH